MLDGLEYLQRVRVLYVDDDETILGLLIDFLKTKVKEVYYANNGEDGLKLFYDKKPDVIISDIEMPILNGIEMVKKIRETNDKIPVIFTTAHNDTNYLLTAIELRIRCFITKPVRTKKLLEHLIDISKNICLEEEIKEKNSLLNEYKNIIDISSAVLKSDKSFIIEYVNDIFLEVSGYERYECIGARFEIFVSESYKTILQNIYTTLINKEIWKGILENKTKSGDIYYVDIVTAPILNQYGEISEFIFLMHDITESVKIKKALQEDREKFEILATTDMLTKIFNRFKFNQIADMEMDKVKRYGNPLSLIMFDIDHFKMVNDDYGHQVGDYVLKELSKIVQKSIRNFDILARWGGEEFVILSPETHLDDAYILADRIRVTIFEHQFKYVKNITCSFGVTEFKDGDSLDLLTKRADIALYRAKELGRNRVEKEI